MGRLTRGFTVIELLIAMMILGIVTLSMMQAFTFQAKTHEVVSGISESQQSLALLAQLIERDLRNEGYMVSDGAAVCGVDNTDGPDLLFVSDSFAISSITDLSSLETTQSNAYVAAGAQGGNGLGVGLDTNPAITQPGNTGGLRTFTLAEVNLDESSSYDNTGNGVADSDFQFVDFGDVEIEGGVILFDTSDASKGVACGIIKGVAVGNQMTVDFQSPSINIPIRENVLLVPAHVYQVDDTVDPPRLLRNGLIVAKDVEDIQISYFYDLDDDGLIDPGESRGEFGGGAYLATEGDIAELLRDVTVTLAVRTPFQDSGNATPQGRPQDLENHDVTSTNPPADGYRRRILTSTVYPRNVGNELED